MKGNIRLPNITADTDAGRLRQVQSYLYQLVEQLNWSLENVNGEIRKVSDKTGDAGSASGKEIQAQSTFNDIKGLIIKSGEIVNAYYEKISVMLEGMYVSQSQFGTFSEATNSRITANSTSIEQFYTDIQQIITDLDGVESTLIEVNAHIRSGLLYYDDSGAPVYGLEIGQRNEADGEEVFNKYARFTSEKLSFYDSNDNEVAYVSDKKLYITHVEVTGSFRIGGFVDVVQSDGSVATKWVSNGSE